MSTTETVYEPPTREEIERAADVLHRLVMTWDGDPLERLSWLRRDLFALTSNALGLYAIDLRWPQGVSE